MELVLTNTAFIDLTYNELDILNGGGLLDKCGSIIEGTLAGAAGVIAGAAVTDVIVSAGVAVAVANPVGAVVGVVVCTGVGLGIGGKITNALKH